MKTIEVTAKPTSKHSDRIRPKVITWNDTKMIRNHSFLASINDICRYINKKDVVKIGIVGEEGSGKSTLAESISHAIHVKMKKLYNVPFAVRIFYEEDLLNFRETLKSLTPANYVLTFDDVSFLEGKANRLQLSAVKQAITKIRHLEGGTDVKIVLVNNYHYTLGLDKYLRQSHFKYFTTVGSSELDNMEKIVKGYNMGKVHKLIQYIDQGMKKDHWTVKLTPKEFFRYKWQDPFIPVLFFDNTNLRHVVTPTRQWMDRYCSVCETGKGTQYSEVPVDQFCQEGEKAHGERTFQAAAKLLLFENGMAVHAKSILNAKKWLSIQLSKKLITLDQIMNYYNWNITKTRLRDQFSHVVNESNLKKVDDTKKGNLF